VTDYNDAYYDDLTTRLRRVSWDVEAIEAADAIDRLRVSTAEHLANRMGATFVPEPQAPKYSAPWISQQIGERSWLPVRACSMCGTDIGYVVNGTSVWFRSDCDCVSYETPDRRSSFDEIADMLAMQYTDEHRDERMARMLGRKEADDT
jgi:hypothetical protein